MIYNTCAANRRLHKIDQKRKGRIKDVCRNMVVTDAAHCGDCAGTADQRSVFVIVCGVCPWRGSVNYSV